MRNFVLGLSSVALMTVTLASCGPDICPCDSDAPAQGTSEVAYEEACPLSRLIGRQTMGCGSFVGAPGGGVWVGTDLFAEETRAQLEQLVSEDPVVPVPPDAATIVDDLLESPYCIYAWQDAPAPPTEDDLQWLQQQPGVLEAVVDCRVVVPLASVQNDMLFSAAHNAHRAALDVPPLDMVVSDSAPVVRVAVIDDRLEAGGAGASVDHPSVEQDANGAPLGPLHGLVMRQQIDELSCAAGGLRATAMTSYQALALHTNSQGVVELAGLAGSFGYQSHLAQAMAQATLDWWIPLNGPLPNPPSNLVINLSVGFEPTYSNAVVEQLFRSLLQLPSCLSAGQALAVAAAGNRSGGASEGVMLPAAFESEALPAACSGTGSSYTPLIHAIHGRDAQRRPIVLTREHSLTRLSAPAMWGATTPPQDCIGAGHTTTREVLTGTSVAAAGVSALAALIWQRHDDWSGSRVMDAIYEHSAPIAAEAEHCLGDSCPGVHHVTFCPVLRGIDSTLGEVASCPSAAAGFVPAPAWTGQEQAFFDRPQALRIGATDLDFELSAPECGYTVRVRACDRPPRHLCPHQQLPGGAAAPWAVRPQPEWDPDPVGLITEAGQDQWRLILTLAPSVIESGVMVLRDAAGNELAWDLSDHIDFSALTAGGEVSVLIEAAEGFVPSTGYMAFVALDPQRERFSVQSQLNLAL